MADFTPRSLWQIDRLDIQRYRWYFGRSLTRLVGAAVMGLLLGMHLSWPTGIWSIVGATLVSLLAGLLLRYHLKQSTLRTTTPRTAERLTWTTALLGVFGVQVVNLLTHGDTTGGGIAVEGFLILAPLAAQAMLASALIGPSVGIVGLTLSVMMLALVGAAPTTILAAGWLVGAVGSHAVNSLKRRGDLFRVLSVQVTIHVQLAAVTVGVAGLAPQQRLLAVGWAALAAVIALSIFWFGVAVLEKVFGIVSDWTLLELCSPESPLMHELNLRAPGTYAHSVGVGNLAETAAREIGANTVLCRTMAYYHDIGKLARPGFFIENQLAENFHDEMPPSLSAKVIAEHVKDGVEMAQSARLPLAVVDGIRQHHGTTLISYFYHRALNEGASADGELELRFRYEGPKPQSREVAILHMADMVEAASRTVRGSEELERTVTGLIEATRADGQLDECDLTFRDLRTVADSFVKTLAAVRHERVTYPNYGGRTRPDGVYDNDPERLRRAVEA